MIHIGHIIKEVMESQERTPTWLARKINCERPNIYYIFQQPSINTELLLKISIALNHDFFSYYSRETVQTQDRKNI
ncbi:MAG: XRE family transcriptional regulator [Bacteroidales bacterium]|nr:XRE family transcriptional regulator [Bacteroidales bacterium]